MPPFEHVPHPHLAHRKAYGAPTVGQAVAEHPSFNLRLAARGTKAFGSMPAFYIFLVYGALGAIFVTLQATLLYWSNWAQLWSLPLLAVGSAVLGIGMNKMMQRQFDDVEALLHGQDQLAQHLAAQDAELTALRALFGTHQDQLAADRDIQDQHVEATRALGDSLAVLHRALGTDPAAGGEH